MAAIYSNGGNHWNILGFNFTKRDALSSVYKISMITTHNIPHQHPLVNFLASLIKAYYYYYYEERISVQNSQMLYYKNKY